MEINLVFACPDLEKELVVPLNHSQTGLIPNVGDYFSTGGADRRKVLNRSFAYGDKESVVILELETMADMKSNQLLSEAAAARVRQILMGNAKG